MDPPAIPTDLAQVVSHQDQGQREAAEDAQQKDAQTAAEHEEGEGAHARRASRRPSGADVQREKAPFSFSSPRLTVPTFSARY